MCFSPIAQQVHGLVAQVARALGGRDDERAGRIRDQAAVEHAAAGSAIGLADEHLLQRQRRLHVRVGMQQRVRARVDRHARQLLARRAVLVHVAPRDHGVVARDRAAVGLLELRVTHLREHGDRGVAPEACRAVLAGADQDGLGLAPCDRLRRVPEHDAGACAARDHRSAQRGFRPRYSHSDEPSIVYGSVNEYAVSRPSMSDDLESRVVERALGGLCIQPQAGHVRHLADVRFADADDRDLVP